MAQPPPGAGGACFSCCATCSKPCVLRGGGGLACCTTGAAVGSGSGGAGVRGPRVGAAGLPGHQRSKCRACVARTDAAGVGAPGGVAHQAWCLLPSGTCTCHAWRCLARHRPRGRDRGPPGRGMGQPPPRAGGACFCCHVTCSEPWGGSGAAPGGLPCQRRCTHVGGSVPRVRGVVSGGRVTHVPDRQWWL